MSSLAEASEPIHQNQLQVLGETQDMGVVTTLMTIGNRAVVKSAMVGKPAEYEVDYLDEHGNLPPNLRHLQDLGSMSQPHSH